MGIVPGIPEWKNELLTKIFATNHFTTTETNFHRIISWHLPINWPFITHYFRVKVSWPGNSHPNLQHWPLILWPFDVEGPLQGCLLTSYLLYLFRSSLTLCRLCPNTLTLKHRAILKFPEFLTSKLILFC